MGEVMKKQKAKNRIRLEQIGARDDETCCLELVDGVRPYVWIGSEEKGIYGVLPDDQIDKLKNMVDRLIKARTELSLKGDDSPTVVRSRSAGR
jgi:hypothetical protein